MSFLLNVDSNTDLAPLDAPGFEPQTVLLGICIVFAAIIIIWFSLVAIKFFLHNIQQRRQAEAATQPKATFAPTESVVSAPIQSSDDEIIVAIAAAIAAAESENSGLKFRVVSFRRR